MRRDRALSAGKRGGRQAEMERHLNYQWNFREGDLPPQLPPNHYSVHLHRPYLASPGGPCPTSVNLEGMACDWQGQLQEMRTTVRLLQAKCGQELSLLHAFTVPEDTVALRRAANASLLSQMEHFTSSMSSWAGTAPCSPCIGPQ